MDYTNKKKDYLEKLKNRCVLRGYSNQTIKSYVYNVGKFLDFVDRSRLNLSHDSVRSYLLIQNLSVNSVRLQHASISFFFRDVLNQSFSLEEIPIKKKEKVVEIKGK